jgi:hypothetical protein
MPSLRHAVFAPLFFLLATGSTFYARVAYAADVEVTTSSPPEAKLASLDAHTTTIPESTVRTYGSVLDQLDPKCTEDRERIGDIATKGVELLQGRKGVKMSYLKFLQAMNDSIPPGTESLNLKCAEIASILVTSISRP